MIVASIDIGTNTVLLLIASIDAATKKILPLHQEYSMPRIGKGLNPGENINVEKINSLMEILKEYNDKIQKYLCENVMVIGTNALRISGNSGEIAKKIKNEFGYNLQVISGDDEADIAYLGATSEIKTTGNVLVIDIGGGSTELIIGKEKEIFFKKSFFIGSVSVTENFLKHSPPLAEELDKLRSEIPQVFNEATKKYKPQIAVAIAGTPTTLSCMKQGLKEYNDDRVEGSFITKKDIKTMILALQKLTSVQIREKYGNVMRGREDIILAGTMILSGLMNMLGLNEIKVSSRGIRFGAIIKYLNSKII